MNDTGNPEKTSSIYNAYRAGIKLFTFLNFFLMLILISDFFLEPKYEAAEKNIESGNSARNISINISLEDSLKISNGKSEVRENEQAAFTPIFKIEKFHKFKKNNEDGYSVNLEPLFLPLAAVLSWFISFIIVIKPRGKEKEPALMHQLLLLPVIVSFVYWFRLYDYFL